MKVKLTKEDLKEIAEAAPPGKVAGRNVGDVLYAVSWRFANTPPPPKK